MFCTVSGATGATGGAGKSPGGLLGGIDRRGRESGMSPGYRPHLAVCPPRGALGLEV